MDYHIEIERLRLELLQNRNSYTLEQMKEGYQRLEQMTIDYLVSEGK